ncbi:MAG TPA: outer membrane beta-barrel protein [Ferruginibacter sp.]|nr:outer membrane beta-barrel protein [Ferruginibacter sp.]HRO17917.1 outer membrane beta-barrel protein [Ferruginibacter sp.]HRQ21067.1 outer membrane beta-barrel protein [Ferruginibacter sp.]
MKKLFMIAAFTAASFATFAQEGGSTTKGFKFSVGANAALPIGDLADFSSFGAGVDIQGQYWFSDKVAATLDAGFTSLFGKDGADATSLIPVRAGIRYMVADKFYLSGKVGMGSFKTKGFDATTAFGWAAGAGYQISSNIDLGLTFDSYTKNSQTNSMVNLRVGYTF